jgi:aldose 1-epimerase
MDQTITTFGSTHAGEEAKYITLDNGILRCTVTSFGATLCALWVKDPQGVPRDVVLGYDTLSGYESGSAFLGATIGRHANRIAGASLPLGGKCYPLPANEGENQLHGGEGFHKRLWDFQLTESGVTFTLTSPHLDQGFPGTLTASVTYALEGNALVLRYAAFSDRDTVCNLTNHSYFNLNGAGSGTAMNHVLWLNASHFTPVSSPACIPTGEIRPVEGTPFDFRTPTPMGARINEADSQLRYGNGYDHNWCIDGAVGTLRPAARVVGDQSGIAMTVETDLPGVQFYAANGLSGNPLGKGGAVYENRQAFCLETQFYPDSPHHLNFPQPILQAGDTWNSTTIYRFE